MKKYIVTLTAEERQQLSGLIASGKAAARKLAHARVLLHADAAPDGPAWTDERVAAAYGCTPRSLGAWRKQAVEDGPLSLSDSTFTLFRPS